MQLIWYGHSCFMIKTDNGKRILMDPFDVYLGYNSDFPKCDLITISHNHFDHSYINKINNETKIITTCEKFDSNFLQLRGVDSFHDNYNGLKRGHNTIYIFKFENISLAHLGDLGHIPDISILRELTSLDFLLVPIGGNFTLDGVEATKLCKLLTPHYIIPMHYKTPLTKLHLDDCKKFIISISSVSSILKINSNSIDLSSFDLKNNSMKTLLLKPPY